MTRAVSDEYCQANITKSKTIGGVSFTGVARRKSSLFLYESALMFCELTVNIVSSNTVVIF